MSAALQELKARLEEIEIDLGFVALAFRLRPRIGDVLRTEAGGEVVALAKMFMDAKRVRPEGFYGPLLVRLLASLERYVRRVVSQAVVSRSEKAPSYEAIRDSLGKRNIALTGRLLADIDSPLDHLSVDPTLLIQNLASCIDGGDSFSLNPEAFSATVAVPTPAVLDRTLSNIGVRDWWDSCGANADLRQVLGTKKSRETAKEARSRLTELCRWRNHLAHGGDGETALSEAQLRDALKFVAVFAESLDNIVMGS
jgi:hypothetical protein